MQYHIDCTDKFIDFNKLNIIYLKFNSRFGIEPTRFSRKGSDVSAELNELKRYPSLSELFSLCCEQILVIDIALDSCIT